MDAAPCRWRSSESLSGSRRGPSSIHSINDGVERRAWPHRRRRLAWVREIVPADLDRRALHAVELRETLRFLLLELLRDRYEGAPQTGILRLDGERASPIHRQVE